MAYTLTNLTDYVARENATLTKTLFAGGDTGKFAMKLSGVKGSTVIPHLSGAATLQSGSCNEPSGNRVATEVVMTVAPFTAFEEFCQDDLQTKFPNLSRGSNNNGADLAPWEEQVIDTIISSVNMQLELTYWQGDTAGTYDLFDGFIKKIDAGSPIDGNPTGITSVTGIVLANVIEIVEGMYSNHTNLDVKRQDDFVILVGDDVFDLYIQAQKAANQYWYSADHDNGVYKIGGSGATLQRVYGLAGTDRLFSSTAKNFWIGADVDDEQDIADIFYDQKSDKTFVRVKGKAGVTLNNIDEIAEFTLV